ncbi:MAG: TetR family transcriptional regulator C-terminal domain-containing protein [Bombilactobacillus mellis]|nr:TetR family transcriptional regulator C-terminal domain-containing protein [Bombilactobacillus mellis]
MSAAVTSGYLLRKLCNLLEQPQGANLTIKELTACCAVSRSTIYRHFPAGLQDLCLAILKEEANKLLQYECNSWQSVIEVSVNYIAQHRWRFINLYKLVILEQTPSFWLKIFKKFLLSYITQQLQADKLLDFVQKRPYELDFLAAGMLFQLLAWLDGQLKTKPEVVIQQLLSGVQLFLFHFYQNQCD